MIVIDQGIKNQFNDQFRAKLSKSMQVQQMVRTNTIHWCTKYEVRNFGTDEKFYKKSREQKQILNYASGNTLFIFIYERQFRYKSFSVFYWMLCQSSSTPKVLVISAKSRGTEDYTRFFKHCFAHTHILIDIEILTLSKSYQRVKY